MYNKQCLKCSGSNRSLNLENNGLCKVIQSAFDGLPVRCVGDWAYEKIYYLTNYFNIFSTGMHIRWRKNLNYIEICCGPGRCIGMESSNEFDGTCLSILNSKGCKYINNVIFVDVDENIIDILNDRIKNWGFTKQPLIIKADYCKSDSLQPIIDNISDKSLNLLFIDPTDLSLPFSTIEYFIKKIPNLDLVINIAYFTDLKRNQKRIIRGEVNAEKYNKFLGTEGFFKKDDIIKLAENDNDIELSRLFLDEYKGNLMKHGFQYLDINRVENKYILLFASRNERGLDFWKKAKDIEPNDQRK